MHLYTLCPKNDSLCNRDISLFQLNLVRRILMALATKWVRSFSFHASYVPTLPEKNINTRNYTVLLWLRALILFIQTLALYKSFTYLLTYLLYSMWISLLSIFCFDNDLF